MSTSYKNVEPRIKYSVLDLEGKVHSTMGYTFSFWILIFTDNMKSNELLKQPHLIIL